MKKEEVKDELIKRYKYIYENAFFILAPFMYQETIEERDKRNEYYKKEKLKTLISKHQHIYLKPLPAELLLDLESFLLSDIPFEESKLYSYLENKKKDSDYLKQVQNGINLLKIRNSASYSSTYYSREKLDTKKIFSLLSDFILDQSGDLKNRDLKYIALDEYFRINRYTNDGKVWTSGASENFKDLLNHAKCLHGTITGKSFNQPTRAIDDVGLKNGVFINFICDTKNHYEDNLSILTEEEKQDIYLAFHDELPWNLEITCSLEEQYIPVMLDARLKRPDNTEPCGENFKIVESEIFVNPNDSLYRYYQLCPHCGWIVNIPKEILSDGIKKRIEERCALDRNLFRKKYLYSELFSLEKKSTQYQKKLENK